MSSHEKAALATAAGAHHTVNYREGDAAKQILAIAPDGVDVAVELAPAQNNALDLEVVRNRGTIAIYANNGGDQFTIDVRATFSRNLRYQFLLLYTLGQDLVDAAAEDINAAVEAGAYDVGEQAGLPLHHHRSRRPRPRTTPWSGARSARCCSTSADSRPPPRPPAGHPTRARRLKRSLPAWRSAA